MSAGGARVALTAGPRRVAMQAVLVVLVVGALTGTAVQVPRLVGALRHVACTRAGYAGLLRQVETALRVTDPQTVARQAEAAREALAESASVYLTAPERDAALARIDSAARDAGVALYWEPLGVATGEAEWPCAVHRYLLVAHGEFGALLRYVAAVAEDAPPAFALDDLHVGPDPSASTDDRTVLRVTLTAYALAETDEPARPAPRAVQGSAQAGQE